MGDLEIESLYRILGNCLPDAAVIKKLNQGALVKNLKIGEFKVVVTDATRYKPIVPKGSNNVIEEITIINARTEKQKMYKRENGICNWVDELNRDMKNNIFE